MTPIEFIYTLPAYRRTSLRQMAEELNKAGITTKRGCKWRASSVYLLFGRDNNKYHSTPKLPQAHVTKALRNLSRAESLIRSSLQILQDTNG
jgi:hypothetical protein